MLLVPYIYCITQVLHVKSLVTHLISTFCCTCTFFWVQTEVQLTHYLLLQQCHLLAHLLPLLPQPAVLLQRVLVVVVFGLIFRLINLGLPTQDTNVAVSQYQSHSL